MHVHFLILLFPLTLPALPAPRLRFDYDIWNDRNASSPFDANRIDINRLPRVLNFFPVPFEEECISTDKRRNVTSTCQKEIFNNLTYFTNPDFPDITSGTNSCNVTVKKIDPEIVQLRLDFIHFNLGQPNRRTGVCEEDVFVMFGGVAKELKLCGLNSGQHAYFDVDNIDTIEISMNFSNKRRSRLWEIRVIQVPFSQRAPPGCLQYHTGATGVIQTMNFAENGRHLAEQDYNVCMRQEHAMCTIAYEPCDEDSFKIGAGTSGGGNGGGATTTGGNGGGAGTGGIQDGNGAMDGGGVAVVSSTPGALDVNDDDDVGSGDGNNGRSMTICTDRITMPCNSEDLIMPNDAGPGFCELSHCGSSLCPMGETPCRIESTTTPFVIGVQFGAAARDESPDDNLGMCLKFEQLPCTV